MANVRRGFRNFLTFITALLLAAILFMWFESYRTTRACAWGNSTGRIFGVVDAPGGLVFCNEPLAGDGHDTFGPGFHCPPAVAATMLGWGTSSSTPGKQTWATLHAMDVQRTSAWRIWGGPETDEYRELQTSINVGGFSWRTGRIIVVEYTALYPRGPWRPPALDREQWRRQGNRIFIG